MDSNTETITVDIEFDVTCHISTRLVLTPEEYKELQEVGKMKVPTIHPDSAIYNALKPITFEEVDIVNPDEEQLENVEFEIFKP